MRRRTSGTWAPPPPPSNKAWKEASRDRDLSSPIPYDPAETYSHGQVIVHAGFGIGVVMGVKQPNKIIVVFKDTTRKLLMGRNKEGCGLRGV
jgi:hypothetical protein